MSNSEERQSADFLHLPHWSYPPKLKGLSGIYLNTALRNLSIQLTGIFIPIYIYQITNKLEDVFLFYILWRLVLIVATIPIAKFISKKGPDISMLISNLTRSVYLILLTFAPENINLLWAASIFGALTTPLYWIPYHTAFSAQTKEKKISTQVAKINTLTKLACVTAPLLGGVVADQFGFKALFPLGIVLLVISTLPIFMDTYNKKEFVYPRKRLQKAITRPWNKYLFSSSFFRGFINTVDDIVWPLLLFLTIPNLEKVGGITTATLLISVLVVNWASRIITKFKPLPFNLGCAVGNVVWIGRTIFTNPLFIALSNPIYQISQIFTTLPLNNLVYSLGKERSLSFFVEREVIINVGRLISCLLIFFALRTNSNCWRYIPLIAVAASLLSNKYVLKFHKLRNQTPTKEKT